MGTQCRLTRSPDLMRDILAGQASILGIEQRAEGIERNWKFGIMENWNDGRIGREEVWMID